MARMLLLYLSEKDDTGRNLVHPGAVEVQLDQDLRFGRIASDGGGAHDGRALSSLKRHRLASPSPPSYMVSNSFFGDSMSDNTSWHGTTILSVRKNGKVVVAGDGQVSLGQTVIKANARKVRRLGDRSEDHTSEPQSLMRISYAVFCLKKKKSKKHNKLSYDINTIYKTQHYTNNQTQHTPPDTHDNLHYN